MRYAGLQWEEDEFHPTGVCGIEGLWLMLLHRENPACAPYVDLCVPEDPSTLSWIAVLDDVKEASVMVELLRVIA